MVDEDSRARRVLWQIRMVHTLAWVVFASSIVAIPIVTLAGRIHTALWLSLLVWVEVFILAANRLRCPLTGVARRYTRDRSDNFDIFLPEWLATPAVEASIVRLVDGPGRREAAFRHSDRGFPQLVHRARFPMRR
jgi:hypothetical protein